MSVSAPEGNLLLMTERWDVDRVIAAAPDSKSEVAGRKLSNPVSWSDTGTDGVLLWGACQGSGKKPYQVSVDTAGPRYKCSCPSRKFPCKHALGLLFLWAEGHLTETGEIDPDIAAWGNKGSTGASASAASAKELTAEEKEKRAAQTAERLAARESRVDDGMAELIRWLDDLLRNGLATLKSRGYGPFDALARRMVDAQAAGVAAILQDVGSIVATGRDDWVERTLDELSAVRTLAVAWLHRDELSADNPDLAEVVRAHIGFPHTSAEILDSQPAVRDTWTVLGLHDTDDGTLTSRRVWLYGQQTQRFAVVQSTGRGGADLELNLLPGTYLEADLHFYPGQPAWRAVVGTRHTDMTPLHDGTDTGPVPDSEIRRAASAWTESVAAEPWVQMMPARITGALVHDDNTDEWYLSDADGAAVRVTGAADDLWTALLLTDNREVTWWGEWSDHGIRLLSWARHANSTLEVI